MGLNLVIGCHQCKERIWFFRGHLEGMESFYRFHWKHQNEIELSNDQGPHEWVYEYHDVRAYHGVWESEDGS